MHFFTSTRPLASSPRYPALFTGLLALLLAAGITGCDTLGDVFGEEDEATVTIEEIGDGFLVADGIRYEVTGDTEFEGIDGLSDLSVGDEVEIGYEGSGNGRRALEIEMAGAEDDDGSGGIF